MILRVYQFLIICQNERFFRNHMISTDHHSGNGNNCFLVSAPLFDMPIFDSKVWLLPAFDCDKGALHHHWFDVITCFFAPDRFFLPADSLFARSHQEQKSLVSSKIFTSTPAAARIMVEFSSVMPGRMLLQMRMDIRKLIHMTAASGNLLFYDGIRQRIFTPV